MDHKRAKIKRSRRLGIPLTPKAHRYLEKRPNPPGQHGGGRRRRPSDYGKQLTEKQRLQEQYNLRERQLRNYFRAASRKVGNTGAIVIQALESRLDVAVLRGGFARTIYQARQLVNHAHFRVNGKKVDIPSYRLDEGDEIKPREKSKDLYAIAGSLEAGNPPDYIDVNEEEKIVKFARLPELDEVPITCEIPLVVEYYSR